MRLIPDLSFLQQLKLLLKLLQQELKQGQLEELQPLPLELGQQRLLTSPICDLI